MVTFTAQRVGTRIWASFIYAELLCVCGDTAPIMLPVVWPQVCCFEALRLLSWKQSVLHRLANGAEKCHETQTLLYRCFSVRCAFLFQFRAGSSAISSLMAYLVFSQQICLKIVLLLHCPERLKIDGVLVEPCDNTAENKNKSSLDWKATLIRCKRQSTG